MLRLDIGDDQVARILWNRHRETNTSVMLLAAAREQNPAAVRWEHFQTWYELTQGEHVAVAYPDIAPSVLYELYAPGFSAHESGPRCLTEWWQVHNGFELEHLVFGHYVCEA